MPSIFPLTSVRGQPIRTTPSFVVVALAPEAAPIVAASRCALAALGASARGPPRHRASSATLTSPTIRRVMVDVLSRASGAERHALRCLADARLAERLHLAVP